MDLIAVMDVHWVKVDGEDAPKLINDNIGGGGPARQRGVSSSGKGGG
jgi:hypothetical protein